MSTEPTKPQTDEPASAPVAGERITHVQHRYTLSRRDGEMGWLYTLQFVTSSGRVVDSREAADIALAAALAAGQVAEVTYSQPVAPVAEKTEAMTWEVLTDAEIAELRREYIEQHDCRAQCVMGSNDCVHIARLIATLAERDQKIAELTAERDAQIYCTTCGNCGEDGCCNPGKCVKVRCLYGDQSMASYTEAQTAIATLESSAKEMQSTIEAQAREIEANAALREEIAELIAELKKQKRG